MPKKYLTFKDKKDVMAMSLEGMPNKEIAIQFEVPTRTISALLRNNKPVLTNTEQNFFSFAILRENQRITELKDLHHSVIEKSIKSLGEEEKPHLFIDKMAPTMAELDKQLRLNNNQATENKATQTQHVEVDIAKVLEQLKTVDEKKAFLLSRLNPSN